MNTIAFVAGKSGGHIIPCLTLATRLKQKHADARILFFSTQYPLDLKLIAQHPAIDLACAHALESINYHNPFSYLRSSWQLVHAFVHSLRVLRAHRVQRVISTGGYNALPVCLAAYVLRIPIELWELNVQPGKALRVLAPLAHTIHSCFAQTQHYLKKYPCTLSQYPLRYTTTDKHPQEQALTNLGLSPHRVTVFIMGGSQGSQSLNMLIKHVIEHAPHLATTIQCIHQTGARDPFDWTTFYAHHKIPALVFPYRDDVDACFNAADIVICRAGAGTLFELAFFEKRCLIVPLTTHTTSHQLLNAQAFIKQYPQLGILIEPTPYPDYKLIAQYLEYARHKKL